MLPDYFFSVAASSTGKYHPPYALGEGGLVRHTKAAVTIAHELLQLEMYNDVFTPAEKDLIIAALILHDGKKHGDNGSQYTVAEHPLVVADWIAGDEVLSDMLPASTLQVLRDAIASHMGQWNTDYKTKKEILPKPQTEIQKFVHLCDYLASRKYLEFNFGDNYYTPGGKKTDLELVIEQIIEVCKKKIKEGCDRNVLYSVIADNNGGVKNPNSITEIKTATTVLNKLQEV